MDIGCKSRLGSPGLTWQVASLLQSAAQLAFVLLGGRGREHLPNELFLLTIELSHDPTLASVSSLSLPFCPLCFPFSFYIIMWERPLCFCFGSPASDFAFWIWESPTTGDLGGMWNLLESEGARNLLPLAAWVWLDMWPGCSPLPLPAQNFLSRMDRPEARGLCSGVSSDRGGVWATRDATEWGCYTSFFLVPQTSLNFCLFFKAISSFLFMVSIPIFL